MNCDALNPKVYWLYGLSGAGKTTLITATAHALFLAGRPTVILDGDQLRCGMCSDLGFTMRDRLENVRRTAEVAKLICKQGYIVMVALMTPSRAMRHLARAIIGSERFSEVYVKCDFETCSRRDPKGLYALANAGRIIHFPGKDLVFEEPISPDLVVDTKITSQESCVCTLLKAIIPAPLQEHKCEQF